jgi:hypothetical protein
MTTLLVVLTIVEIAVVVTALVVYLVAIARSLRRTAQTLAKVSFGVRAIETQCSSIGPSVLALNARVAEVSTGLAGLADLATDGARPTVRPA